MTALQYVACSVACFRLTRLITDDKIMDWLRRLVVRQAPQAAKKKAKEGIECPFCVSFYYSVLIAASAVLMGWTSWLEASLWQPAIWGGSVLLNQLLLKLTD